MKVLDVKELQDGIDQFIREIDASFERISRVQRAVRNFHALDDALKGEGGDALRNFF